MVTVAFVANSYEYKCARARVKRADSEMYGYLGEEMVQQSVWPTQRVLLQNV